MLDLIAAVQSHFERVELFVELRRHLADLLVILTRVLALLEPEVAVDREQAAHVVHRHFKALHVDIVGVGLVAERGLRRADLIVGARDDPL